MTRTLWAMLFMLALFGGCASTDTTEADLPSEEATSGPGMEGPVKEVSHPGMLPQEVEYWGRFSGPLNIQFDPPNGRTARLLDEFWYEDRRGRTWRVPKGWQVDGSSIPRSLWSYIDSPWVGLHRYASVTHDFECDTRKASWPEVHLMYYEACRCAGLGWLKAKTMYWAIYWFGPRWILGGAAADPSKPARSLAEEEAAFERIKEFVKENNPDIADVGLYDPFQ